MVFDQLLKLISKHEFETLTKQHYSSRAFRKASRWVQFVAMMMGQIADRNSLRDMLDNLSAQSHHLHHLGSRLLSHSRLLRINNDKPYQLYKAFFAKTASALSATCTWS